MNVTEEQFFNFIRRSPTREIYQDQSTWSLHTKHYLRQFNTKSDKKFFLSWNWAAFFFRDNWFIFRKMYLFGLLATFVPLLMFGGIFFLFAEFLPLLPFLGKTTIEWFNLIMLLFLILSYIVIFALMGDALYISWVKKKLSKNKEQKKGITWILGISWCLLAEFVYLFIMAATRLTGS